jgi:hypothetical protein
MASQAPFHQLVCLVNRLDKGVSVVACKLTESHVKSTEAFWEPEAAVDDYHGFNE